MERGRAEHLSEAEHREHVDGGGTATPAERPPGHHPGGVGRHDDGDRAERVTILGGRTAAASASNAAAPCRVNVTLTAIPPIVRTGCHGERRSAEDGN